MFFICFWFLLDCKFRKYSVIMHGFVMHMFCFGNMKKSLILLKNKDELKFRIMF